MHLRKFFLFAWIAIGLPLSAICAETTAAYVYTDLGDLPIENQTDRRVTGNATQALVESHAYGISATGHVEGVVSITTSNISTINPSGTHAVFQREIHYFDKQTHSFGAYHNGNSFGRGINTAGQIAGGGPRLGVGVGPYCGVFYGNGLFADIGSVFPAAEESSAYAINENGHISGSVVIAIHHGVTILSKKAILWNSSSAILLNDLSDINTGKSVNSLGRAINNSDQVAGWSDVVISGVTATHGCIMQDGHPAIDLGTLVGTANASARSEACGISDAGDVCGYSMIANGSNHAFLYYGGANGKMLDLGTLSRNPASFAFGMNNHRVIVGETGQGFGAQTVAMVWTADSGMQDLNKLTTGAGDWEMQVANAVNDAGQIVGDAENRKTGETHGFLLTPTALATPPSVSKTPTDFQVLVGQNITIASNITGSNPLTFQWYNNGTAIPGATSANLSLSNVQMSSSASYSVTATNLVGVTTAKVTMTVIQGVQGTNTQPTNPR